MSLFALGVNHTTANVAEREKIAFSMGEMPHVVRDLFAHRAVDEAVVLSTCNRMEVYAVTRCHHAVKEWLGRSQGITTLPLFNQLYEHHDAQVIKHLMTVASGLDSMVVGEPQILGQMKHAYQLAHKNGTIGKQFRQLFPAVFETAKRVRTETGIGCHAVTMAYAVVQLAKDFMSKPGQGTVMLLGCGETIELVADYLHRHGIKRLLIVNRTLTRAHKLARRYNGVPMPLEAMSSALKEADIVISAISSQQALVSQTQLEEALQQRRQRPIFIADLGMPRNIDPAAANIDGVHLCNIDDLQRVIENNQASRFLAVDKARAIIEIQTAHYLRLLRVREASDTITAYRRKMEAWRDEAVITSLKKLENNTDPQTVITTLAQQLTNKFMHPPTAKLREACYDARTALLDLIREIYEL